MQTDPSHPHQGCQGCSHLCKGPPAQCPLGHVQEAQLLAGGTQTPMRKWLGSHSQPRDGPALSWGAGWWESPNLPVGERGGAGGVERERESARATDGLPDLTPCTESVGSGKV